MIKFSIYNLKCIDNKVGMENYFANPIKSACGKITANVALVARRLSAKTGKGAEIPTSVTSVQCS